MQATAFLFRFPYRGFCWLFSTVYLFILTESLLIPTSPESLHDVHSAVPVWHPAQTRSYSSTVHQLKQPFISVSLQFKLATDDL